MAPLKSAWKTGAGPIDSGIFFPDDTFCPTSFSANRKSIEVGRRRPIPSSMQDADYGDYEAGRFECDAGVVRWGGGPWESEGWISLEEVSGDLTWLMHFEDSEAFTQARFDAGQIEAVAYEYPNMATYLIPATRPDEISIEQVETAG